MALSSAELTLRNPTSSAVTVNLSFSIESVDASAQTTLTGGLNVELRTGSRQNPYQQRVTLPPGDNPIHVTTTSQSGVRYANGTIMQLVNLRLTLPQLNVASEQLFPPG
jgi:hypothetical protein